MSNLIKRAFRREYNNGYDSARELTLELLDHLKTVDRWETLETVDRNTKANEAIKAVSDCLYNIDLTLIWWDDTSPDQVRKIVHEIENYLATIIIPPAFLILEKRVNTALKRCIDVLA